MEIERSSSFPEMESFNILEVRGENTEAGMSGSGKHRLPSYK